nr:MAG TPA: hypothetical protein [Caudoviricetes sp.]DAV25917.1 MAG TPA: hypothetical protein [Caudoviricetes sp.]
MKKPPAVSRDLTHILTQARAEDARPRAGAFCRVFGAFICSMWVRCDKDKYYSPQNNI